MVGKITLNIISLKKTIGGIRLNLENIYFILPGWAKNIAINLEGYRIKRTRYSPTFFRLLKEAKKRTYWSKDRIIESRSRQFDELNY